MGINQAQTPLLNVTVVFITVVQCKTFTHKKNEEIVAFKKLMSVRRETSVKNMSIYANFVSFNKPVHNLTNKN